MPGRPGKDADYLTLTSVSGEGASRRISDGYNESMPTIDLFYRRPG
jgi:hypothetical protein